MFYDPRGQVIRTLNPDGSEQRVIYGVPVDLADPDRFAPTPWEAYTYDANDLHRRARAPTADPSIGAAPASHHLHPASIVIDALGRTIEAVARNGSDPAEDWYYHPLRLRHPGQRALGDRRAGSRGLPLQLRPREPAAGGSTASMRGCAAWC